MRGLRGVTAVDLSVRSVAVDRDDRSVAEEKSVGVGDAIMSERESEREVVRECRVLSGAGDMCASDEGGVGTTARSSWSRRIAISLLASGRSDMHASFDEHDSPRTSSLSRWHSSSSSFF